MQYEAILAPSARKKKYDAFPPYIQEAVTRLIDKVCANPLKNSRKATFPYLPSGQTATVKIPKSSNDDIVVVTMFFRFGQDEKSIEIAGFGSYVLGRESGDASLEDE